MASPTLPFHDGKAIPQLGFGVWQVPNDEAAAVVSEALRVGYRSIDTAAIYGNEEGVGAAIRQTDVPREELFITTKLWNADQGYDETLRAFDESLRKLGLESIDLYLIHWPCPQKDAYVETWRAFQKLKQDGRVKSIGVSNFTISNLERLFDETGEKPVLNQVELHPRFQQKALRDFHAEHGILTESWSPLGRGQLFDSGPLTTLARKYGKSVAQVILRWHLDSGLVVIPKSVTPGRIRENFDVLDFRLEPEDIALIAELDDKNGRVGPDPETLN
ncbi:aldo/keto reductase [Microvirga pudoricolor]|uniref:aldo/keto reductase n=1 Tax=Microvirga pudoricolor TaxID=2778729 RepID=UPI0019515639|nr:aldo/keto reductase [Microvirga pudoricolor]MBM6596597.1 aldo/keto reductase [Microvirga pudoricolor]